MIEYGIFSDESADYTADEALEASLYSREAAEARLREYATEDDSAHVHAIEEADDEEEEDGEEA